MYCMFPVVKHASSGTDCRKSGFSLENNQIFFSLTSSASNVTLQGFGKYKIDKGFARSDWRSSHWADVCQKSLQWHSPVSLSSSKYFTFNLLPATTHPYYIQKYFPEILNMHLSNNHRSSEMSHCAFVQCFFSTAFSNLEWGYNHTFTMLDFFKWIQFSGSQG